MTITLYGSTTSPFVRHCRIALAQENLDHQFELADYQQSLADSPTGKVPFLRCEEGLLTDSSSILHFIRSANGSPYMAHCRETEIFATANTALDTLINLFLLERSGITEGDYLERHHARLPKTFDALEAYTVEHWDQQFNDGWLRLACLIDWARFRNRWHLDPARHPAMVELDKYASAQKIFEDTRPDL